MSFVQNYIGLEARIEAVVRRLLADFDIDLSNYPTIDEMNEAIAEAIAGGGGGGTNNYMLLINKPLESVENDQHYGWQMFRATDGKRFALYVGQDGTHCAMMTYDATANRFGIGLVNHPDTITLNDDGTVTINGEVMTPNLVPTTRVEEMIATLKAEIMEMTYTKAEVDAKVDVKANASEVYARTEVDTMMATKADTANVYTRGDIDGKVSAIDAKVATKANASEVYTRDDIDGKVSAISESVSAIDAKVATKANASDVYTKEETYDRTTIDEMIAGGGGTTDYNNLSNRPIVDDVVVSKTLKMESGSLLHLDGGASELCLGSRELPPSIPPTYVAVAKGGTGGESVCATSRDWSEWTLQSGLKTTEQWSCIAYGDDMFIARSSRACATTQDGATWTEYPLPDEYIAGYMSIAYGGGVFVGVGTNAMVIASTNGLKWTALGDKPDSVNWFDVCYGKDASGNGIFVAVTYRPSLTLANIVINDKFEVIRGNLMPTGRWRGVSYGNGTFVAVGPNIRGGQLVCATSSDGINWVEQPGLDASHSWGAVRYSGGCFVALSGDSYSATSRDNGVTWNTYTFPFESATILTVANGDWYAMDGKGKVAMSKFGDSWTELTIGTSEQPIKWYSVCYGAPEPIRKGVIISTDADGTGHVIVNGEELSNIGGGGGGGTNDYDKLLNRPIVDVDGVGVVQSDLSMNGKAIDNVGVLDVNTDSLSWSVDGGRGGIVSVGGRSVDVTVSNGASDTAGVFCVGGNALKARVFDNSDNTALMCVGCHDCTISMQAPNTAALGVGVHDVDWPLMEDGECSLGVGPYNGVWFSWHEIAGVASMRMNGKTVNVLADGDA